MIQVCRVSASGGVSCIRLLPATRASVSGGSLAGGGSSGLVEGPVNVGSGQMLRFRVRRRLLHHSLCIQTMDLAGQRPRGIPYGSDPSWLTAWQTLRGRALMMTS